MYNIKSANNSTFLLLTGIQTFNLHIFFLQTLFNVLIYHSSFRHTCISVCACPTNRDILPGPPILWEVFFLPLVRFLPSTPERCVLLTITKTRLYNFDPIKPHFYIVKLGFTGVYIIFLFLLKNIDCGYSLNSLNRSNEYPQSMFWTEIRKKLAFFYMKIFNFWSLIFLYIWIGMFS